MSVSFSQLETHKKWLVILFGLGTEKIFNRSIMQGYPLSPQKKEQGAAVSNLSGTKAVYSCSAWQQNPNVLGVKKNTHKADPNCKANHSEHLINTSQPTSHITGLHFLSAHLKRGRPVLKNKRRTVYLENFHVQARKRRKGRFNRCQGTEQTFPSWMKCQHLWPTISSKKGAVT